MPQEQLTQFDYLLNAFEHASQADKPAEHGYGDKRRALFAYVRELEAKAAASTDAAPAAPPRDGLEELRQMLVTALADHRAALSTPAATTAAPPGWKLVPLEPTHAMVMAADKIIDVDPQWVRRAWAAMLAAAPTAQASPALTGEPARQVPDGGRVDAEASGGKGNSDGS